MVYAPQFDDLARTFDNWRRSYDDLSYAEHLDFYEALYEVFPNQDYGTVSEAVAFGKQLPMGVRVLELGGWSGRLAGLLLSECPHIDHWFNFEVCKPAVANGLRHLRYSAAVPDDFIWNVPEIPQADVLFSTHTLEHLSEDHIRKLLSRLTEATFLYAEAPLPTAGPVDWTGDTSTHVLKLGWRELEALFDQFGWKLHYACGDVRIFRRIKQAMRTAQSETPPHVKLGRNVAVHPTANLYRSVIGDETKIAAFAEIGGSQVGARCKIQAHAFLCPGVIIEDEVFIGPGVRFTNDLYPRAVGNWSITPTRVEKGASIGAGAVILAGVTIGAQALVGAGSVVTDDIAPKISVTGNPARESGGGSRSGNERDVLLVLGDPAVAAANSMRHLSIDKVWFPRELGSFLPDVLYRFITETKYRNYLLISQEFTASPRALTSITELLRIRPAATGYFLGDCQDAWINLPRLSHTPPGSSVSAEGCDSSLWRWSEVEALKTEFSSGFGGWSLVGMRRKLWLQHPFRLAATNSLQSEAVSLCHKGCEQRVFSSHYDALLGRVPELNIPDICDEISHEKHLTHCRWELLT